MLSKGKSQEFEAVPPSDSGFLLQGMVESLVHFDGDTALIVAGINRDRIRVFKHARKVLMPGL